MRILLLIVLFIIATIPLLFAAVEPWIWSVYGLLMMVSFVVYLWSNNDTTDVPVSAVPTLLVGLFFVWSFVLSLPIPFSAVSTLSPVRAEILSQARRLADTAPAWETLSYSPKTALAWWSFLLSLALFFVVLKGLGRHRKVRHRIVLVMIAIGLLESVYGLIQTLMPSMGVLWVDYIDSYLGTARGTFINRNNFAGHIEMIWPLALGVALSMTGRVSSLKEALNSEKVNRQALMALGLIVLLMALVFTRSRGGIISGLAGLTVFAFLARKELKAIAKQTRFLLGGIFVLLSVYMITIGIGPIVERFLSLRGGGLNRMDIWQDSLEMVKDHPTGIGLANYETVFTLYNKAAATNQTVVYAHNDYLQLLIEAGWVGFACLLGGFFIFMWKSACGIGKLDVRRDPLRFYLAVGAFSGLISMAVHGLFDFNFQIPANVLYFVVLAAILSACTAAGQTETKGLHRRATAKSANTLLTKRRSN